jgi:hypothetical protein
VTDTLLVLRSLASRLIVKRSLRRCFPAVPILGKGVEGCPGACSTSTVAG